MNAVRALIILGLAITVIGTVASYPLVPEKVVTHWNAAGQADGYMAKSWGLALIPLIMIACVFLFFILPRIDPLRRNYAQFMGWYEGFILIFVLFMLVVQAQIILWSTAWRISPNVTLPLLIAALFIYIGFLLGHTEQNWFIGIRTPWTLSSSRVWTKTHAVGGRLFIAAGIIAALGVFAGAYAVWFILLPAMAVAVITVVYSYVEFRKEGGSRGN